MEQLYRALGMPVPAATPAPAPAPAAAAAAAPAVSTPAAPVAATPVAPPAPVAARGGTLTAADLARAMAGVGMASLGSRVVPLDDVVSVDAIVSSAVLADPQACVVPITITTTTTNQRQSRRQHEQYFPRLIVLNCMSS